MDLQTITKLRQITGAGMVDCKKALEESNNDLNLAIEILRKKGEAKAAKKADRETKEGLISFEKQGDKIAVVSLACETDFVSRGEDFQMASAEMPKKLLELNEDSFRTWAEEKIKNELVVKIGENIQLLDAEIISGPVLGMYLHANKKVAAVVVLSTGSEEVAVNVAMQAVAMTPDYLAPSDVPVEILEKEKEIIAEQLKAEGKPVEIIEKIMAGKVNKYYEENCLLNQLYIKDDSQTVSQYLKSVNPEIQVLKFKRFEI